MYRAILFDLYDTVVMFHPRVPVKEVAGTRWRSTLGWLTEVAARELPGVPFDDFIRAITETTTEIIRNRPPDYFEVPSRERFRRALVRLGCDGDLDRRAEELSRAHMQHLASATEVPADHLDLLRDLGQRYALGLVSNFDDGPTAHAVLGRHGLTPFFNSIVISDGFGRRKPHPAIFRAALDDLQTDARDALFVGDSAADDVAGARAAEMDAVWINASGATLPAGNPSPRHTIARLVELRRVLSIA